MDMNAIPMSPVRISETGDTDIEGILVPFARAEDDCWGSYWDKDTDFAFGVFQNQPILFQHKVDSYYRSWGVIKSMEVTEEGIYVRATLNPSAPFLDMIREGKAGWSSGSLPNLIDWDFETGYIRRWPIVEASVASIDSVCARNGLTKVDEVSEDKKTERNEKQSVAIDTFRPVGGRNDTKDERLVMSDNISVRSEWDRYDVVDMLFHHHFSRRLGISRSEYSDPRYYRAIEDKVDHLRHQHGGAGYTTFPVRDGRPGKSQVELIQSPFNQRSLDLYHRVMPHLRAAGVDYATGAAAGDELVATLMNSMVAFAVLHESKVANLLENFMMTSNPFDYPVITGGPDFYNLAEHSSESGVWDISGNNPNSSQVSTAKKTFIAGKLAAKTLITRELIEDSTIDVVSAFRQQYEREMAFNLDWVLLNGDTDNTTTNISNYGTAPGATSRITTINGIRKKLASGDSLEGTTIDDGDIISVQKAMGPRGIYGRELDQLVCVTNPEVAYKIEALANFSTMDKVGDYATLIKGQLGFWRGIPLVVTDALPLTDANGRIDDTASQNTKGSFLVLNRRLCKVGYRRMPSFESGDLPTDGSFMRITARFDYQMLADGGAAYGYNLTV